MAALTANSWTIAFKKVSLVGTPPRRMVIADLTLAGVDTYPNDGIPLPTLEALGFKQIVDSFDVVGVNNAAGTVSNYTYAYDAVNHKLFVYEEEAAAAGGPLLEADAAEVPGPRTLRVVIIGW